MTGVCTVAGCLVKAFRLLLQERNRVAVNVSQSVHHLKACMHTFRLLAAHLKRKLNGANQQKLWEIIAKFPRNQRLKVEHCMRQVTAKSAWGMRYDQQWILSCVMMRIKSPNAYRHLCDNGYLLLPSKHCAVHLWSFTICSSLCILYSRSCGALH